jgi:hypothetical protein
MQTSKRIVILVFIFSFIFNGFSQKNRKLEFSGCWIRKIANEKFILSEDSTMTNIIYGGNGEIKSVLSGTWKVVRDSLIISYNTSIVLWPDDKVYFRNPSIEFSEPYKITQFSRKKMSLKLVEFDKKYKLKLKRQENCDREVNIPYKIIDATVIKTKMD